MNIKMSRFRSESVAEVNQFLRLIWMSAVVFTFTHNGKINLFYAKYDRDKLHELPVQRHKRCL